MNGQACPSSEELSDYLVGKLDDQRLDEIDEHIGDCETCQGTIVTLSTTDDTLLSNIRSPLDDDPYEQESACRNALAAIAVIGRDPSFAVGATYKVTVNEQEELGTVREYRLLAKLGQGGMGAVYKALHTKLEKVVALKVLPPDKMKGQAVIDRFEREMKAVGKLDHPNIVAAHDAGEIDGTHYLVMELVEGFDLSDLVRRLGPAVVGQASSLPSNAGTSQRQAGSLPHSAMTIADACEMIRQAGC